MVNDKFPEMGLGNKVFDLSKLSEMDQKRVVEAISRIQGNVVVHVDENDQTVNTEPVETVITDLNGHEVRLGDGQEITVIDHHDQVMQSHEIEVIDGDVVKVITLDNIVSNPEVMSALGLKVKETFPENVEFVKSEHHDHLTDVVADVESYTVISNEDNGTPVLQEMGHTYTIVPEDRIEGDNHNYNGCENVDQLAYTDSTQSSQCQNSM